MKLTLFPLLALLLAVTVTVDALTERKSRQARVEPPVKQASGPRPLAGGVGLP
ncbi:MAG: hypothetical protein ABMA26_00925 [Limisphaerales bacterium]